MISATCRNKKRKCIRIKSRRELAASQPDQGSSENSVPHFGSQTAEMTDPKKWEGKTAEVQGLAEEKLVSQRESLTCGRAFQEKLELGQWGLIRE